MQGYQVDFNIFLVQNEYCNNLDFFIILSQSLSEYNCNIFQCSLNMHSILEFFAVGAKMP